MYTDAISDGKTMGDVDVLWHEGVYHLFHLTLPNHDFIAHATSRDGLSWERVENALFIGHPGEWDDHMLWTMHVSPDPHRVGGWRMFYTGLSRNDHATVQRLGIAISDDLLRWRKLTGSAERLNLPAGSGGADVGPEIDGGLEPIVAATPFYEDDPGTHRKWVSFRDPFFYRDEEHALLLMAARTSHGPTIRRGCIGVAEEVAPNRFELRPPLHHPGQYEDVEVPNLFTLDGRYFLVGSLREDAKIRYWYCDNLEGPWRNFYDNVLLAGGNYAGRISRDDRGPLVWNFYTPDAQLRNRHNMMPPPKRLLRRDDGRLGCTTFEAFDDRVQYTFDAGELGPLQRLRHDRDDCTHLETDDGAFEMTSVGGFHGFLFRPVPSCFRLRATLRFRGDGKCGLLFRLDPETSDGYYLSMDFVKGIAQLRAWGRREGTHDEAFRFAPLQVAHWTTRPDRTAWNVQLLAVGGYLEFSLDDIVLLSLVDQTYDAGRLGFYVESATLRVEHPTLDDLRPPVSPSESLHEE